MVDFNDLNSIAKRIRREIDIVEVVGEFLAVEKHSRTYLAKCPWHKDSRPSLQLNPARNTWKCWVCEMGGDSISFVMKYKDVDFRVAVHLLIRRLSDD
jgi:DNA primase